jgi:N-dimethylarginine dimethylaminohydrolase
VLVAGYRPRSAVGAQTSLGALLGVPVRTVDLVDERFYHVDLVFCPVDERRALIAPQGLDRYGCRVLEELVSEPVWLTDDEATAFCANSVVVGDVIVMPWCTPRLGRVLEAAGKSVAVAPVGEFLKAGGGCRCLTLALDVDLARVGGSSGPATGHSVHEGLVHELP